ncbi:hypothetical protein K1719_002317 [Acacia pycnantha]|nr:hypothetical protein K1719_002317 [Acacia pycnantha]
MVLSQSSTQERQLLTSSLQLPFIGETLQLISAYKSNDLEPYIDRQVKRYGPIFRPTISGFWKNIDSGVFLSLTRLSTNDHPLGFGLTFSSLFQVGSSTDVTQIWVFTLDFVVDASGGKCSVVDEFDSD